MNTTEKLDTGDIEILFTHLYRIIENNNSDVPTKELVDSYLADEKHTIKSFLDLVKTDHPEFLDSDSYTIRALYRL